MPAQVSGWLMSCAYTPPTVLLILRVEDPNARADTPPADGFGFLGTGHFEEAGEEVEKQSRMGTSRKTLCHPVASAASSPCRPA